MGQPAAHRDELLRAFRITEDDLALNQLGRLGPRQIIRIRRGIVQNLGLMLLLLVVFAALILGTAERPIQWWRWLLIGGLAVALVATGVNWMIRLRQSAAEGAVVRYSGPVKTVMAGRAGMRLVVDGQSFGLPVPFWRIGSGLPYDVYVAPRSKLIVAMVPITT
jgi:hypothetical protein